MCGIAGIWFNSQVSFLRQHLIMDDMLKQIGHRGPDGKGSFTHTDVNLTLGHTRLSIVDLKTGKQPIHSKDGEFTLTANGEFYGYRRDRAELISQGYSFQTKSDSEVAIAQYRKHGLDFLKTLRGEFAFALYDSNKRRLILARDRFGVRPLFYYYDGQSLTFASEIKSLFSNPRVPKKIDEKAALHQLVQTMPAGMTLFESIYSVKPGHCIVVELADGRLNLKEYQYWDVEFPEESEYPRDRGEKQWIEEVREALIEAIHLRLDADVPVGCYLSGGIDSCAILGLTTALKQSPVRAFTISFPHKSYDELNIAKRMSQQVKAKHSILKIRMDDLYKERYEQGLWHSERTFYNTLGIAKLCMSQFVRENGYKVILTGEGADELFAGYPFFKQDYYKDNLHFGSKNSMSADFKKVFEGAILPDGDFIHPAFESKLGFTPAWIQNWVSTFKKVEPILSRDFLHRNSQYDPFDALADSLDVGKVKGRHSLDKSQYTWIKTQFETQILGWGGERMDMAYSIETRPPFLDHKFFELGLQVPPYLRVRGGIEKWVLREAVKSVLPEILYKRQKFAFMAPPAHLVENGVNPMAQLREKYLTPRNVRNLGILDEKKLDVFWNRYCQEKEPSKLLRMDALLNHVIGLHILEDQFLS